MSNREHTNILMHDMIPEYIIRIHSFKDKDKPLPVATAESIIGRSALLGATKNNDWGVVLPQSKRFEHFADGMRLIVNDLGLGDLNVLWAPDLWNAQNFTMTEGILADPQSFFKQIDSQESPVFLHPLRHTRISQELIEVASEQGVRMESTLPLYRYDLVPNPLNRSGWARPLDNKWISFPDKFNVPYPPAYLANNVDEIKEAYRRVTEESGRDGAVLKIIYAAGGGGVHIKDSLQELIKKYEEEDTNGLLNIEGHREFVEIQAKLDIVNDALLSFQFIGDRVITPGGYTIQLVNPKNPNSWIGNKWNCRIPGISNELEKQFRDEIKNIQTNVISGLGESLGGSHNFRGGFDFCVAKNSERKMHLVGLELNGGRPTGADHINDLAHVLHVDTQPFLATKTTLTPACSLGDLYCYLKEKGLFFNQETKTGIVPPLWIESEAQVENSGAGNLFITAQTEYELDSLFADTMESLERDGLVH